MTISQIIFTVIAILCLVTLVTLKYYYNKIQQDPMTPYSVSKRKMLKYNFKEHLTRRVSEGSYFERFVRKSDSWITCPCGNLPQCILRDDLGVPDDDELESLGNDFSFNARLLLTKRDGELSMAQEELLRILRKIEIRGNVVSRQEIAKHHELAIMKPLRTTNLN